MRHWLLAILVGSAVGSINPALAQLRTIPQDAKRGEIRHLQEMVVEIDGKPQRLSPGAQIRDANNRIIVPSGLLGTWDAKYLLDRDGMVHRVWILTNDEAKREPRPVPGETKN